MGWFKRKSEIIPLPFDVGDDVIFVDGERAIMRKGKIVSVFGGISWRHYYIQIANTNRVKLVGEPFITKDSKKKARSR